LVKIVRNDIYFENPGPENTNDVVEAVKQRVDQTNIKHVIIASDSGDTAVKFAEALAGKARVFCVCQGPSLREWGFSWPSMKAENETRLKELDAVILNNAPFIFHNSMYTSAKFDEIYPEKIVRETLYFFGQGLKVAVEVVLMATMCGLLNPSEEVIGVGGSSRGSDTALIMRSTYPTAVFSKDPKKRLEIKEIICMPRSKK